MRGTTSVAIALLAAAQQPWVVRAAIPNCPYLGPVFPKPTNLTESDTIKQALGDLDAAFQAYESSPASSPNLTSWSVQVFSASQGGPLWENYHTAPNVNASYTSKVDGDTIYRLGSVTKVFTILTFLAEAGDKYWNMPITDYIPELAQLADIETSDYNQVMNVSWEDVTLGSLASQMAGIVRDYGILGELTQEHNQTELIAQGFPHAPPSETPRCGEINLCTRAELFEGLKLVPPSWTPYTTPGYSNLGYQLLAYALEEITGKNFTDMLHSDIITPLGLEHTYYTKPPNDKLGVITDGGEEGWAFYLGDASPTGNMYSSVNDLSSLGRAIFQNKVISRAQTRRWLQPAALTSELVAGVGYPWGVRRIPLSSEGGNQTNRIVDSYGKAGSINAYQALLVLLPDYDVGITALLAGQWPGNANWDMADTIGNVLVPALEQAARLGADAAYAGTYEFVSSSSSSSGSGGGSSIHVLTDAGSDVDVDEAAPDGGSSSSSSSSGGSTGDRNTMNSTLVLSTDPSRPGLGVDRWVSNGTDMIPVAVRYTLNYDVTFPMIRLYPTGMEYTPSSSSSNDSSNSGGGAGKRRVAFKAVVENLDATDQSGKMFSTDCGSWVSQTTAVYADRPLDQFVFTLGADGRAEAVEPLALRAKLSRTS